jgi:GNAT superfamily N-acetyltransferase
VLLEILDEAYGGMQDIQGTKAVLSSYSFNQEACFIAEDNGSAIGCIAVTSLPRKNWHVIRYLAVRRAMSRIEAAQRLLGRAIEYAESKSFEYLRATTPAIQPYVDVYKTLGFKPTRRDFRISWNLQENPVTAEKEIDLQEVTGENMESAARIFVKSLDPFWDWRTEEQGGQEAVARSFEEEPGRGAKWMLALSKGDVVGLTGLIPDYYKAGEGRFRGAYVVPEQRAKGLGAAIMREALSWAAKLDQRKMTVYTFSYLDSLAPGALLYLKSGGKIDSEYLQLQKS